MRYVKFTTATTTTTITIVTTSSSHHHEVEALSRPGVALSEEED
jgi:hypothetical protein